MSQIAIQGVRGSYSEEATLRIVGGDAQIIECQNFEDTYSAVRTGMAEYAVVPVENKIVGEIEGSMSLLRKSAFRILERLPLEVRHVLAGTADADFESLKVVRSHIEALKQCRNFFALNTQLVQEIGADTAASMRRIIDEADPQKAAICSRRAAEIYGAKILKENIADDPENWTTFYLIGN